jgi:hypothetical protein
MRKPRPASRKNLRDAAGLDPPEDPAASTASEHDSHIAVKKVSGDIGPCPATAA